MPLVFRVTNTGDAPVTLPLLGRAPNADFRISNAGDEIVWSRLRGQMLVAALRLHQLDAGATLVFKHVWKGRSDAGDPVPPGDYLIRGVLMTDAPTGLSSSPVRLRIEP